MALFNVEFASEALGMQVCMNVVIPQQSTKGEIGISNAVSGKKEKFKSLLLLHGLSDDYSIWLRRTSIERYATERGIALIMPSADRSFYTDMKYGGKYYTYIAKEVPAVAREFFNISDKREDSFVAGVSMGGYGALKIAMKESDKFCCGAALSPVSDIRARAKEVEGQSNFIDTYIPIFGEDINIPDSEDLFYLSKQCEKKTDKPRLFIGVGTNDFMYDDTQRLRKHLNALDLDFTYKDSVGSHGWGFWDKYIQYVLDWMNI